MLPHNTFESDSHLINEIRQNNHQAFRDLYYKYFESLLRYASYRLHSIETAHDLVQEVFLRVWLRREYLDPDKSIKAYLYKSLTNLIINHSRLHSSYNISLENVNAESSETENSDLIMDVNNAINKLPEKFKTVYLLSRVEGFKYDEIAEICNISVKSVEKRMSKVFKLLRKNFPDDYLK